MRHVLVVLLGSLLLAGCVPTIGEVWDRQPVSGRVFDAESGAPIAGARVWPEAWPEEAVETDARGHFSLPGRSRTVLRLAMVGSAIDETPWRVEHPRYRPVRAVTPHLLPPSTRMPQTLAVPLVPWTASSCAGSRDDGTGCDTLK